MASDTPGCCGDPCLTVGGFHTLAPADKTDFRLGCDLLTITNWLYELVYELDVTYYKQTLCKDVSYQLLLEDNKLGCILPTTTNGL